MTITGSKVFTFQLHLKDTSGHILNHIILLWVCFFIIEDWCRWIEKRVCIIKLINT